MNRLLSIGVLLGVCSVSSGAAVSLSGVPAYNWYHGCGPTAAGSVVGYYDLLGFSGLFDAEGWDSVKLTANVQDQISSPTHNAKYDPTPDNASLPVPEKNSLASWFGTSVDPLEYGWSYLSRSDDAFEGYAAYRGYECDAWYKNYGATSWEEFTAEIDAGRPVMFLVDSDGNGGTDHFVNVFGYDDRGDGNLYYGLYTGWSESEAISWKRYRPMASGHAWGVGYLTFVEISARDGDGNTDGEISPADVDLLCDNIPAGDPAVFDMDGDGDVDEADMIFHVENFLEFDVDGDGIVDGQGTFRGDFNCDGAVNGTDLSVMNTHFGSGAGFAGGNANTDSVINGTDLSILAGTFGQAAAVPEPLTVSLLAMGAGSLLRKRRS